MALAAGPDHDLSTDGCGAVEADDLTIPIVSVTYDAADATAEVELDAGAGLEDGPHRLIACAEEGLTDLSGDELDGNGDSIGGDDFVRTFRMDRVDAFVNGHFDCNLGSWVPVAPTGSTIEHEELIDIDNAVISGSARLTNAAGNTELSLGQCVEVQVGAIQEFSGFAQLMTSGTSVVLVRACEFFEEDGCFGAALPVQAFFDSIADTGIWVPFGNQILVPLAASSTLCQATIRTTKATPFEALLDDLSLDIVSSPVIFQDGFESGDTSAWPVTVP